MSVASNSGCACVTRWPPPLPRLTLFLLCCHCVDFLRSTLTSRSSSTVNRMMSGRLLADSVFCLILAVLRATFLGLPFGFSDLVGAFPAYLTASILPVTYVLTTTLQARCTTVLSLLWADVPVEREALQSNLSGGRSVVRGRRQVERDETGVASGADVPHAARVRLSSVTSEPRNEVQPREG